MRSTRIFAAIGLALAAGGLWWAADTPEAGVGAVHAQSASSGSPSDQTQAEQTGDDAGKQASGSKAESAEIAEMALGAEDAPVTVIEYASYTCPHCQRFHAEVFDRIKQNYVDTGKVRFVYREVYFHRPGLWASMLARCGGEEKFFGVTDLLFDRQSDWIGEGEPAAIAGNLRKIGRTAGLSPDSIQSCMRDSDKAQKLVNWYEANAEADKIDATPTFIINGEKYSNMSYSKFSDVLDEKLAAL